MSKKKKQQDGKSCIEHNLEFWHQVNNDSILDH